MTVGIYKLSFGPKVYIGQSKNIEARYLDHLRDLKANISSKKLNEAFVQYGYPILEILLEVCEEELNAAEKEAILIYDSYNNGLNATTGGDCSNICNSGEYSYYATTTNLIYEKILDYLVDTDYRDKTIADLVGVSNRVVQNIRLLHSNKWLKSKYPEKYAILEYKYKTETKGKLNKGLPNILKKYPDIKSPDGEVFKITTTLADFAREHNLTYVHLHNVINSTAKSHKGWVLA